MVVQLLSLLVAAATSFRKLNGRSSVRLGAALKLFNMVVILWRRVHRDCGVATAAIPVFIEHLNS